MSLFAIVVLLLFQHPTSSAPSAESTTGNENRAAVAQQEKKNVSDKSQISSILECLGSVEESSPAHNQEKADSYNPRSDKLYRWYLLATIIGVGGGLIGIVVIICQTFSVRRSADAARDAARAATDSANILANSERAWIMADLQWMPGPGKVIEGEESTSVKVVLSCRNDGKAPAWITQKHIRMEIFDYLPRFEDVPLMARSKDEKNALPFIEVCTEPVGINQPPVKTHVSLRCGGHRRKGNVTVIWGVVIYRDVFKPERTTHFGYTVTNNTELHRIAGIERFDGYNQNT